MSVKSKVIIYGLGSKFYEFRESIISEFEVVACSDIDLSKSELVKDINIKFVRPLEIKSINYDYIVVTSLFYREIKKYLCEILKINSDKILSIEEYNTKKIICKIYKPSDKNKDKTFFVIQRSFPNNGLFSNYIFAMKGIEIAIKNRYYPVVDFKYFKNAYQERGELGKVNTWNYYFNQPSKYDIDEVYESKNVVMGAFEKIGNGEEVGFEIINDLSRRNYYKRICMKYLQVNDYCKYKINSEYNRIFGEKEKICGVVYRGTDYIGLRPKGHAIQPKIKELIDKVDELISIWGYKYIYLATEDSRALNSFKDKFKEKLLFTNQVRFGDTANKMLFEIKVPRKNDRYLRGLEYLISVGLLARCEAIIGAQSGATTGALLLNNYYEHEYFFNLGVY